jgi:hypothetical protein
MALGELLLSVKGSKPNIALTLLRKRLKIRLLYMNLDLGAALKLCPTE